MYEINGAGIAWQFDHGYRDFKDAFDYTLPDHLEHPERLDRSIAAFAGYTAGLKTFASVEVHEEVPDYSDSGQPTRKVTRSLSPHLFENYEAFDQAVRFYKGVIDEVRSGTAPQDEAVGAAIAVCKISRPCEWNPDEQEENPAYYLNPIRDTSPRWFLESYMRQVKVKSGLSQKR